MRDRRKRNIVIGSLCSLLVFMGIAFAILSQKLTINGQEIIMGDWDVRITNIVSKNPVGRAANVSHSFTNTSASFEADLYIPGDSIEYEVTVENKGNIMAALQSVTPTTVASSNSIKFTHTEIPATLSPGEVKTFTMKVEFDESSTSLPSDKMVKYALDIVYVQYDGKSEITKATETNDSTCFMISDYGTLLAYDSDCGENIVVPSTINGTAIKDVLPSFPLTDGVLSMAVQGWHDSTSENYRKYAYVFINEKKKETYFSKLDNSSNITSEEKEKIKASSYVYNSDEYKQLKLEPALENGFNKYYKISKDNNGTVSLNSATSSDYNIGFNYGSMRMAGVPRGNYCKTSSDCELLKEYFKSEDPSYLGANTYYEYISYDRNNDIDSQGVFDTIDTLKNHYITYPGMAVDGFTPTIKSIDFSNAIYMETIDIFANVEIQKLILPPNVISINDIAGFNEVIFPKNSVTKVIRSIQSNTLNIPSSVVAIASYEASTKISSLTFANNSSLLAIYGDNSCNEKDIQEKNSYRCGKSGFSNANLTTLTIPKTVRYIGSNAFASNKLTTLKFQSGSKINTISSGAFSKNQLTNAGLAKLPSSLVDLDEDAFSNNPNLTQITLTSPVDIYGWVNGSTVDGKTVVYER